jgi:hypothetical protein
MSQTSQLTLSRTEECDSRETEDDAPSSSSEQGSIGDALDALGEPPSIEIEDELLLLLEEPVARFESAGMRNARD